ncbi:MAG: translocation/assembly module TamB, partial [Flavobacteriaceae bacterium]|nr:translocation/assembly module TamB [Bacteroidia bacterium]NNL61437.1 translocation/assembly module TamB [Flavobacteriaceae bacterium]
FKNLFNSEEGNFVMNANCRNLTSNHGDLKALLPNVLGQSIPSTFEKLGNFKITGASQVTASEIIADIEINTDLGYVISDLNMKKLDDIDNASYKGNIILDDFNIGEFLGDTAMDKVSMNVDLDGIGFTIENLNTKLEGDIYSLDYNGYSYQGIDISGNLQNKVFNGKLDTQDQNFKLKFNGLADFSSTINNYDFVANVEYANLKALNFVEKDSLAIFKGNIDMKMKGSNFDDAFGNIAFTNTSYKNENDSYFFKDFAVTSRFEDDVRFIEVNSPDIIQGKMSGKFLFEDIGKLFENSLGNIYTNYIPNEVVTDQYIDFNFKIYNKIVEVFYPDIELGSNTFIRGRVESDEKDFKLTFKSPQIKLLDYFADDIELKIDNNNPLFNTYIEIDSINSKFYDVSKFSLINVTLKDTLFIRSEFKGGKRNDDFFDLSLFYTIDENNKSVVGFKKSDVTFKDNRWTVNESKDRNHKVTFDRRFKDFDIDKFVMKHQNEEIRLSGVLRDSTYKDIKFSFKDVDMTKITPEIDSLRLEGNINGKLDLLQQNGDYLPNSTVVIDDFKVNGTHFGSFDARITGNQSLTNYKVDAKIKGDTSESFSAIGNIDVSSKSSMIDVAVKFNEFNLEPINSFGEGVITNIRGLVTGAAKVTGNLNRPSIDGSLRLDNAGLSIPYLNVDYRFLDNSAVSLKGQNFNFNKVKMEDLKYDSKGTLNGYLRHQNFSDWELGLSLVTDRLLVLDTEDAEDALYYGTGFVGGIANIYGPTNQLTIEVDGETKEGTVFKIPLNDSESFGDNSFIHFLSPEEKLARLTGETRELREITGVELNFDLDITQDALVEIVIDKNSGSSIRGRGEGNLLVEINTNGKFNMYGDIAVFEGVYNFIYGGLVQKEFIVQPGGTLSWDGEPLQAQVDLVALYLTQANPSVLLDTPINRSIPVEVGINLTGVLEKPDPIFDIKFPNVSSAIKSELEYRLDDNESREFQALSVVTTGAFMSDLRLNQEALYGTLSERASSLINSIFSDSDSKFQVGLDYKLGENNPEYQTDDRLGVTLSTKLSDRVLINGKVGVPIGGVSETVIAGDVQIDFLLNEEGSLTMKMFNRENSIRNFGEEIGYTQGLGIAYNVDFDTFKELIEKVFKGKKEKEPQIEEITTEETAPKLPSFMTFKNKSTGNN